MIQISLQAAIGCLPTGFLRFPLFALIVLLLQGCATPVGIEPVDIQTSYRLNTENALSSGSPSEASKMVLRRNDLMDRFKNEPENVLAELHV